MNKWYSLCDKFVSDLFSIYFSHRKLQVFTEELHSSERDTTQLSCLFCFSCCFL